MLPELHAEGQMQASEVASVPHMKDRDRKKLLRSWRKLLPKKKAKKAQASDLAGVGIAVEGGAE